MTSSQPETVGSKRWNQSTSMRRKVVSGEIIVIGRPEQTTTGNYASVATSSGPPGGGANAQLQENSSAANNSVDVDSDASDDEIVVIAQRLKSNNQSINMQLTPVRIINLPCIGPKSTQDIRKLAVSLRFQVTTTDYGPGRAGENLGASGTPINVIINKRALKGYDALSGGLAYLSLHEIAHSFKEMRDFNKAQFEAYIAGAGRDLSYEQQKAQFPNSPEFRENEARTNSIAKAICDSLNGMAIGFFPTNGYTAQC